MRNKVIAVLYLEEDCKQEDDEVCKQWRPINFDIYSEHFQPMIMEAIDEWLSTVTLQVHRVYELILAHEIERDGGGANLGETFQVIHQESSET